MLFPDASTSQLDERAHLQALNRTTHLLSDEKDPRQALRLLAESIRRYLGVDRTAIFAFHRRKEALELIGWSSGSGSIDLPERMTREDDPGAHLDVARGDVPYFLMGGGEGEPAWETWAPIAIVPVRTGDRLLGTLYVDNFRSGRSFPPRLIELLTLYASLAVLPLLARRQLKERHHLDGMHRDIVRDVLWAVTNGTAVLCDHEQIDGEWPVPQGGTPVEQDTDVARVRKTAERAARDAGMDEERAWNFALCASEAATNALLHAGGGSVTLAAAEGAVRVRVSDHGRGLDLRELSTLVIYGCWAGLAPTGIGFTLIAKTADRLLLNSGPRGTTLIVEMAVSAPDPSVDTWEMLMGVDVPPL